MSYAICHGMLWQIYATPYFPQNDPRKCTTVFEIRMHCTIEAPTCSLAAAATASALV
jgi:hypothetical protein